MAEARQPGVIEGASADDAGRAASKRAQTSSREDGTLYGAPLDLPRWRVSAGRLATLAAIGVGLYYLDWRAGTLGGTGVFGRVFYVAEIANYVALALTGLLLWRVRRRRALSVPPAGVLDVFVTVCGEPVEMVERTLRAALAIEYPHRTYLLNDGFIAGRDNAADVEALAARLGVTCFSRRDGERGKAGNLNHALARTDGDFVATIDADHRAVRSFGDETLGYFARRRVGFVSTPQQFDGPDSDPLGNRELLFYRALQCAKDVAGCTISCGNGVVYRRTALEDIGGFSEWNLVEDVHTSYELQARGWTGVYHRHALTTGTAPETARKLVRQRLRWGADSLRIFFLQNPLLKRGLRPVQRLHYLQTTGFYLVAATQVVFLLGPPLWLLWQVPVMRVESGREYVVHTAPYLTAIAAFLVAYGGWRGALRVLQQQLFLAPVYALAVVRALFPVKLRGSGVTEKEEAARVSVLLLPQVALFVMCALALGVAIRDRGPGADIAGLWAGWALIGLAPFLTALGLPLRVSRGLTTAVRVGAALAMVAVVAVGTESLTESVQTLVKPEQPHAVAAPAEGVYMGVFTPTLLRDPDAVRQWNDATGARARIANVYQQWRSGERRFRDDWMRMIAAQGAVPMVTWEPWRKPRSRVHDANQPASSHARIAEGAYDSYILSWARAAAAYKGPIMLRFMHEMNGNWYPWSTRTNGNTEESYVAAWRHVHALFQAVGAKNISWVWTINSFPGLSGDNRRLSEFYPGDEYVDWVSMTGFNWGTSNPWNEWAPADRVFDATYDALTAFGKPIVISELATVHKGGDAAAWIRRASSRLSARYPKVKAVIWFDSRYPGGIDFRLRRRSRAAFAESFGSSSHWDPDLVLVTLPAPRTPQQPPASSLPASPAPSTG